MLGILIVHAVMRRLKAGCSEIAYTHLRRPEIDHYRTPHSVLPAARSSPGHKHVFLQDSNKERISLDHRKVFLSDVS